MILRLIGPNDEFEVNWIHAQPPAVFTRGPRVWVRAANSITSNQMYFEQQGWAPLDHREVTKVR